jgi:glycine hydroxymethyltransferase
MGGPIENVIASKAIALAEANLPSFAAYARAIVNNASALAQACMAEGLTVATGGTDNHLMLIDVQSLGLTGRQAEAAMRECAITLNRNSLPYDPNGPWYTSGLRLGTPAVTTLGMGANEMKEIASIVKTVLSGTKPAISETGENAGKPSRSKYTLDARIKKQAKDRVQTLLAKFPVYPQLDLAFLHKHFGK